MKNELPFELIAWIKNQQAEEVRHRANIAVKNYREDGEFMRLISFLIRDWGKLKIREKQFICSLVRKHDDTRCLTGPQRSVITDLYLRHCA